MDKFVMRTPKAKFDEEINIHKGNQPVVGNELCKSSYDSIVNPIETPKFSEPSANDTDVDMSINTEHKIETKVPLVAYKIPTTQDEFKSMYPKLKMLLKEYDNLVSFKTCSPTKGCGKELHKTQFNIVRQKGASTYLQHVCRICTSQTKKQTRTENKKRKAENKLHPEDVKRQCKQECQFKECKTEPTFGIKGTRKRLFCEAHAAPGMVNFQQECQFSECKKTPKYGVRGTTKRLFCKTHAEPGMVSFQSTCRVEECKTIPTFGLLDQSATHCSKHKLDGMENVKRKTCTEAGCPTQACFNIVGQTTAIFCSKHKLDGMEDIYSKRCASPGCSTHPSFNIVGQTRPLFCGKHKLDGMVDICSKRCTVPECLTCPSFNIVGQTVPLFCDKHKLDGMVNVKSKKCVENGCSTQPSYGFPGQSATHCPKHKLDGMENVASKTCAEDGCTTIPIFGLSGQLPTHCATHKLDGMEDVKNKRCFEDGCSTQPIYGVPGQSATHCSKHKLNGMENVKDKRCAEDGCTRIPSFGILGQSATHCSAHKLNNMEDVKNKRCAEDGCLTCPIYGLTGQSATHCSKHKLDGMEDVKSKRCAGDGCPTHPCFNFVGQTIGLFCSKHKSDRMEDVMSKRCAEDGCRTGPSYGVSGQPTLHCALHRQVGQIVKPKRMCEYKDCKIYATFGLHTPERCKIHCQETDHDLVLKRCIICANVAQWDYKDGKMCDDCGQRPGHMLLRRQRQVKAWIDAQERLITYDSYDKPLAGSDRLRPDFAWKTASHWVLVEVDEYQHKGYTKEHDENRMVKVTQGLNIPCVWIRFNPDDYKGQTSAIREKHRLEHLVQTIKCCLNLPQSKIKSDFLRVTYLFFDNFDITKSLEFIPSIL